MRLKELVQEETLQAMLKRLFRPSGTISEVAGKDANNVAKMLQAKTTDKAYVIKKGSPASNAAIKSVSSSRAHDEFDSEEGSEVKVVRMPGGSRVVAIGTDMLVTVAQQYEALVEAKKPLDKMSAESLYHYVLGTFDEEADDYDDKFEELDGLLGGLRVERKSDAEEAKDILLDYARKHNIT